MKIKKSVKTAAIFLGIFLSTMTVQAETQLSLMLDWFPNVDHLPIYVAKNQGFFKDAGLEVNIISPSETSDALKLAASGNVDMAVSYEPQTIIAAAQGLDVKAVGRLIEHPLTTLLYLEGKGIKSPKDLEGKKIGYTVPGLMDVLLDAFTQINGVQSYTPVNVGFAIVQSIAAEKVDAVMGPFKTYETVEMSHRGYKVGYFELEKWGIPDYDELIFVCSSKTLAGKKESVTSFVKAVEKGIAFSKANPKLAIDAYFKEVPEADQKTETEAFELTRPYFAAHQKLEVKRWQTFADFALKYKLIEKPVDAAGILLPINE